MVPSRGEERSRCKLLFANLEEIGAGEEGGGRRGIRIRGEEHRSVRREEVGKGRKAVGYARFYAEIKVRIEWRLVQMHTDVKVYGGYLVKETGGKLLRCSRVTNKEEDILIYIQGV